MAAGLFSAAFWPAKPVLLLVQNSPRQEWLVAQRASVPWEDQQPRVKGLKPLQTVVCHRLLDLLVEYIYILLFGHFHVETVPISPRKS